MTVQWQVSTNGYANVSQSGSSNQADVDQNSDALRNRATVTQSGNSGQVGLEQGGGSDNEAVFTQSGTGNFIGDDSTDPAQGPIVQGGSDNDLFINQSGDRNDVDSQGQYGNNNNLRIDQSGAGPSSVNNSINFTQVGSNNGRQAIQATPGATGTSPYGNGDYAGWAGETGVWGYVNQTGVDNNLTTYQDTNGVTTAGNGLIVQQKGSNSNMNLIQTRGDNFAFLYQETGSNLNTISLWQNNTNPGTGTSYNLVDVRQNGSGNSVGSAGGLAQNGSALSLFVDQYTGANNSQVLSNQSGDRNSTYVKQLSGAGNVSTSNQSGSDHRATVFQQGDLNQSTLSQASTLNVAMVDQSGNGNISRATQSGGGNNLNLMQYSNNSVSDIVQSGNSNGAIVQQGTSNNVSNVVQAGNGNNVTVNQNF